METGCLIILEQGHMRKFLISTVKAIQWNIAAAFQKGLIHIFSANLLNQVLGFFSTLMVTKMLSPHEIGSLKIIQSYILIATTFASLGFPTAIIKFCSEVKAISLREYILKYAIKNTCICACCIYFLSILLAYLKIFSDDYIVLTWFPIYAILILPNGIFNIIFMYLQAIKNFKKIAKLQSYMKIVSVFIIIGSAYVCGIEGYVFAILITSFITIVLLLKSLKMNFLLGKRETLPLGFIFLSRMGILTAVIGTLGKYIDIFFLDAFIQERDLIGYYAIASTFVMIGTLLVGSVQGFLTPYLAEKSRDYKTVWRDMIHYQKILSICIMLLCPLIYIFVDVLVIFYYGLEYECVLVYLIAMLVQLWLHSSYSIIGCTLTSLNKEHYNLTVSSIYLIIKIVLSYYFINTYGLIGFIYSQVLAEIPAIICEYIAAHMVFSRKLNIMKEG